MMYCSEMINLPTSAFTPLSHPLKLHHPAPILLQEYLIHHLNRGHPAPEGVRGGGSPRAQQPSPIAVHPVFMPDARRLAPGSVGAVAHLGTDHGEEAAQEAPRRAGGT